MYVSKQSFAANIEVNSKKNFHNFFLSEVARQGHANKRNDCQSKKLSELN